ncbi:alpha/beta-hydrolase [Lindgomyces ingoldianus]|uniref:Alpha/beta-hydrolase n=1 Tax=Lindgomyces ingoldianus TaxID=673940 RepID=A0ACB6QDQ4_9PLEO|nr:alpha/beta-hydrolase [Lindgomyces ingoldianus]KAF2464271.1 alpha/beta-hydrolase [Lindgomyces ingoldianus]
MAVHIPFLSRLHLRQYFALMLSIILIALESLISIITLALPTPIITFCYRITRRLFNYLSSPSSRRSRQKKKGVWSSIANASDFTELCELYGYYTEEHIVQTGDGYLLGLHRLGWRRGEEDIRVNVGDRKGGLKKKVVYLHHGLLMNSEVWVCLTESQRCLPFELVERGYDVWLGNNRGNKYSKKCVHTAPTSTAFWNFSMDQFAFHDIPDSIAYILSTTHQPSLSYIGFSQGTAQAFATLSIHPTLNDKVDVFIALAPAMSPKGLTSTIVDSFVKASPDVLFLAFGRRAILGSATMWEAILYPPIFVRLIDTSLKFLFGWTSKNITPHQKLASYPHLYSFTSTKSVVHWFQIIRNGVFQMYDDEAPNPITSNRAKYYKVAKFPTKNIKTPIVLVYGGSDSLVDIDVMLKELPRHTIAKEIPHYEHLDFLWASSVHELVFPHVFEALDEYAGTDGMGFEPRKEKRFRSPGRYRGLLPESGSLPGPEGDDAGDESSSSPAVLRAKKVSQNTRRISFSDKPDMFNPEPQTPASQTSKIPHLASTYASGVSERQHSPTHSTTFPPPGAKDLTDTVANSLAGSVDISQITAQSSTSRPEGWWSSDEVAGTGHSEPSTPVIQKSPSRLSIDSQRSGRSGKLSVFGERGISLGVGRAVSGMSGGLGKGEGSGTGKQSERLDSDGGDGRKKKKKGRRKAGVGMGIEKVEGS